MARMKASEDVQGKPTVTRWVVDSRIGENTVRMEKSRLKAGKKAGTESEDDLDSWEEPECALVTRGDFREKMGIPEGSTITFDALKEGRVYILSTVEVTEEEVEEPMKRKKKGAGRAPKKEGKMEMMVQVRRKGLKLNRIDQDTRQEMADRYVATLRRR